MSHKVLVNSTKFNIFKERKWLLLGVKTNKSTYFN